MVVRVMELFTKGGTLPLEFGRHSREEEKPGQPSKRDEEPINERLGEREETKAMR